MVCDTPPSQDASTHLIWNSYLKEYRRYGPDTKAGRMDTRTDGRTVRLLYASQSSFGGIKRVAFLAPHGAHTIWLSQIRPMTSKSQRVEVMTSCFKKLVQALIFRSYQSCLPPSDENTVYFPRLITIIQFCGFYIFVLQTALFLISVQWLSNLYHILSKSLDIPKI